MYRTFTLTILLFAVGCTHESTPPPLNQQLPDARSPNADTSVDLTVTPNDVPHEYPERADVTRLLLLAADLESQGKFEEALAVTNQAVAIDPNSPSANQLKTRLEELLRRI